MNRDDIKQRDREIFAHQTRTDPYHGAAIAKTLYGVLQGWLSKWLISHPNYNRGLKCLDIGCGVGGNSEWLGRYGKYVFGLDHTFRRVRQAAERLPERNKFGFTVADGEQPPVKNGKMDIVFCAAILHHLPNYRDALAEYGKSLNKTGLVITSEPCAYNPFAVIRRKFFPSEIHTPDERPFPPREIVGQFKKIYDSVTYQRFFLFSVNAPLIERFFGFKAAWIYYKLFSNLDRILLKIPLVRNMCWLICIVGSKKAID